MSFRLDWLNEVNAEIAVLQDTIDRVPIAIRDEVDQELKRLARRMRKIVKAEWNRVQAQDSSERRRGMDAAFQSLQESLR